MMTINGLVLCLLLPSSPRWSFHLLLLCFLNRIFAMWHRLGAARRRSNEIFICTGGGWEPGHMPCCLQETFVSPTTPLESENQFGSRSTTKEWLTDQLPRTIHSNSSIWCDETRKERIRYTFSRNRIYIHARGQVISACNKFVLGHIWRDGIYMCCGPYIYTVLINKSPQCIDGVILSIIMYSIHTK